MASRLILCLAAWVSLGGCGYTLQTSKNPIYDELGIHRVYVAPLVNDTYKPGVENLVYNEVVKTISQNRRVKVVQNIEDADAVLSGTVNSAYYATLATTGGDSLYPSKELPGLAGPANIRVSSFYGANLGCSFSLKYRKPRKGKSDELWSSGFSRNKSFPGNNQMGVFGTTSALINDSEFDRALRELAEGISNDLHESMLAMF